ncbi:MAG: tellurite resistance TerB family protein [Hyphomicrobiaceae bacterium]
MFDARSLLEAVLRGAGPQPQASPQQQVPGGGGLGDLLGELARNFGQQGQASGGGSAGTSAPRGGMGSLEDLLRNLGGQQSASAPQAGPGGGGVDGGGRSPSGSGDGGLGDILGNLQKQFGGAGGPGGGNLMDILAQVFNQATTGVREGAQRIDDATGASGRARNAIGQATGKSPEDLLNQLKDLINNNRAAAGAAAGGIGAVVLGTQAGRALAGSALKLGALALIGGLAYKAVQNYQQGKPLIGPGQDLGLAEAPRGSGFESGAVTHDAALLYIRGMIAAAAADGRIDASEQQKIMGSLTQAGLGADAEEFLANELNNPATATELASAVNSEQEAVQLFTAARIAVDVDNQQEHAFLVDLAQKLGMDGKLVAHVDAAARAA